MKKKINSETGLSVRCPKIIDGSKKGWKCNKKALLERIEKRNLAPIDCLHFCRQHKKCVSFEVGIRSGFIWEYAILWQD